MIGRHLALIIEDERLIAEDLAEILTSIACDSIIVDNKSDALAALQRETFCFILLDLEIKGEPDSIKGHTQHGSSLLREIRSIHADHTGLCYWLPILIVSGFAREVPAAIEIMKDGANDFIQKPFESRKVSASVRHELERSGRVTHEVCGSRPVPRPPGANERIVLSIPGDRVARRIAMLVGSKRIMLTSRCLKMLLHLMIAHERRTLVHKTELGATSDQGFKGISELRSALKPALGDDVNIVDNDYHGNYFLTNNVTVNACDVGKVAEFGDKTIADLAYALGELLESRPSQL